MENQTHLEMTTERLFLRTITEADVDMFCQNNLDIFHCANRPVQKKARTLGKCTRKIHV